MSRMLREPGNRLAMYWRTVTLRGNSGSGPCGLASDIVPLPLAMYRRLSAELKRTLVGYQPVGMKPSGLAWPGAATLKTATLLASALATKSSEPSGVKHRLFGVLPTSFDLG